MPVFRQRLVRFLLFLADLHSIPPEPGFDDPAAALDFARRAVELDPGNSMAVQSFGWARCRAGDWKGCIETLPEADSRHGAFLAIAHWHLDDRDQARAFFDRYSTWLDGYEKRWNPDVYPSPAMLRRVQAEAAELLGVPSPQPGRAR